MECMCVYGKVCVLYVGGVCMYRNVCMCACVCVCVCACVCVCGGGV